MMLSYCGSDSAMCEDVCDDVCVCLCACDALNATQQKPHNKKKKQYIK